MIRKRVIGLMTVLTLLMLAVTANAGGSMTHDAAGIEVNTAYTSKMDSWDDADWYRFSLPAAGVVSVSFVHEFTDSRNDFWELQIFNEGEDELIQLAYQGQNTEELTSHHLGLPAGTYYMRVRPYMSHFSSVPFTFRVNFEPSETWEAEVNDHKHTATAMAPNVEYSGVTSRWDDSDYYCVTLPAPGYVTVEFSHDFFDSRQDMWFVRLEDGNEERLLDEGYAGTDAGAETSNPIGLPEGTYYLRVYPMGSRGAALADYRVKLNYTQDPSWEREFNDNMNTVNPIETNAEYSGSLMSSDDKDYYTFTLPAPGTVSIRFAHEFCDTASELWKIRIMDEDGNEYFLGSSRGDAMKPLESDHIGLPAGTFYVQVLSGYEYSRVQYRFSVLYTETGGWEQEMNNNAHDANPIEPDTAVNGSLSTEPDKDFYRFEMPADGYLDVEFAHEYVDAPRSVWKVQILNDNNEEHDTFTFDGNTEEPQRPFTSEMTAGTWYIRVSRGEMYSSTDYKMTLIFHEGTHPEPEAEPEEPAGAENAEWTCPECGNRNTTGFCTQCGTKKPEKLVCPGCGQEYDPDSNVVFCGECGTRIR